MKGTSNGQYPVPGWLCVAVAFLSANVTFAQPLDEAFFEKSVRPVLVEQCVSCHGPKMQKGGLRLDTRDGVITGGTNGLVIVPGKPADSRLIAAIKHVGNLKMPEKKLADAEITALERWVTLGVPWPAAVTLLPATNSETRAGDHWSFRAVTRPTIPANGAGNPVDAFIRAKWAEKTFKPSPEADRRTLIRRLTFDLIGLPPTPEEVTNFEADLSAGAYGKLVDRLLASQAYGERWGRHWLDVARYADSNGLDENVAHGNAWRYRDYVIRAFNADKPYDQFLREQIAGDLLPATTLEARREQLIATGFLALGPKVLAEVDKRKMELDIVDEQIDTLGRAVLGLTLGCARCHDHKFDPISLNDYYAMAGIFLSTKTMESFKTVGRWHEHNIGTPDEVEARATYDARTKDLQTRATVFSNFPEASAKALGQLWKREAADRVKSAPEVPGAMGVTEGPVVEAPLLKRGNHLNPGLPVPRRFPTVLVNDNELTIPKWHGGRLELANWITRPDHVLTARVFVNRVWRWHFGTGLVPSTDNFGFHGDKPSHPELLDWLASRFVEDGWSVKKLHRRILLSETFRQAGTNPDGPGLAAAVLARFPPRRLEAEEIRDSLLAVSGRLDRTPGGPAITHVKNREFLFDHTSKDGTTYDGRRRSVYLPVIRNHPYEVFRLFDAPDPAVVTGHRDTTTVATQALFWLNGTLVVDAADALAGIVLADPMLSDADRLRRLIDRCYARPATDAEVTRYTAALRAFTSDLPDSRKAWSAVAQVILSANEFVTIR